MSTLEIYPRVIKNKKLFEKQLEKVNGFKNLNKANGVDNRSIIYIPELQTIAVAGIHEDGNRPQFLNLYKLDIQMTSFSNPASDTKRRSTLIGSKRNERKRISALVNFSRTSLLENLIKSKNENEQDIEDEKNNSKEKKDVIETQNIQKKNNKKSESGQSMNVGKEENMKLIIQEREDEDEDKISQGIA